MRAPSPRTAELMKDELMQPDLPECSTTEQEEAQRIQMQYNALLQREVLGLDTNMIPSREDNMDENSPTKATISIMRSSEKQQSKKPAFHRPFSSLDNAPLPFKVTRRIPKTPYKVLDAPALKDDYYLNLLDWSATNVLAVGLASNIYLWSATSSRVTKLTDLGQSSVSSIGWSKRGQYVGVGTSEGVVQIWDVNKQKQVRSMVGHTNRVGALAWSSSMLASGSRDKSILLRDMRVKDDFVTQLIGHRQEVCGLKWSFEEQQLASGGNDNKLMVWSSHKIDQPQWKFKSHQAAVKALAWSPH